ncbi:NAD(P)/FAD-dependent oxidoreductase [Streptomyces sp. CA-250714]|uniref:NAD(P)/FAD-dependent oxidoreductase n=1 Tax=Streptomyces sp. CA-250714 TaxID=3240060 RepID=UPI003D94C075
MNHPTHVAVIGAGVLGATLAHRLAQRTVPFGTANGPAPGVPEPGVPAPAVTLLDRGEPGHGTSRWSLAWLNSNGVTDRGYHELRIASLGAWARLAEEADGADWYRPVGNMRWADPAPADPDDPAEGGRLTERVQRLRQWGYPAEFITPERASALEPSLRLPADVAQVAWFPEEGYVLTERLVTAVLKRLRAAGGSIRTGRAGHVTGLQREDFGTEPTAGHGPDPRHKNGGWLIHTADGNVLRADTVVCCAGRWTPEVTALAGEPLPIVDPSAVGSPAPGLVVRAGPVARPLRRIVHTPRVHLRPHDEDGGATVQLESGDVPVDLHTPAAEIDRWAATLLARARDLVPGLAGAGVLERRMCVRPLPLDGRPVIGPLPGTAPMPGDGDRNGPSTGMLYVVVTHSGVTLAAGLAELIAAELHTGRAEPTLEPYRPARLLDG